MFKTITIVPTFSLQKQVLFPQSNLFASTGNSYYLIFQIFMPHARHCKRYIDEQDRATADSEPMVWQAMRQSPN